MVVLAGSKVSPILGVGGAMHLHFRITSAFLAWNNELVHSTTLQKIRSPGAHANGKQDQLVMTRDILLNKSC